jgi:holdfast attachment protein HfaA
MAQDKTFRRIALPALAAAAAVFTSAPAEAGSDFDHYRLTANMPYGWDSNTAANNDPVNPSFRDANGNRTFVDGVDVTNTSSSSTSSSGGGSWSWSSGGGCCGGNGRNSAVAIGNSLNVITSGNYNTVIVNADQKNYGNQEANLVLNGNVDLGK